MTQPEQPEMIQPQPVPMTWQIGQAHGPGGVVSVGINIYSPTGCDTYFLDPEYAKAVAAQIIAAATTASSGLILPVGAHR